MRNDRIFFSFTLSCQEMYNYMYIIEQQQEWKLENWMFESGSSTLDLGSKPLTVEDVKIVSDRLRTNTVR